MCRTLLQPRINEATGTLEKEIADQAPVSVGTGEAIDSLERAISLGSDGEMSMNRNDPRAQVCAVSCRRPGSDSPDRPRRPRKNAPPPVVGPRHALLLFRPAIVVAMLAVESSAVAFGLSLIFAGGIGAGLLLW